MTNIHSAVRPAVRSRSRDFGRMLPRAVVSFLLILSMTAAWAIPALAETVYPKATDRIADDAAILSESTVREIKEKNETLISEVQACIAVCTVKTTNGVDIGKYARSVYTEWKLPTGVLLLIASEDNAFYLVQSASISDKITNEDLEGIRDREIEEDFAAGNVDRAVRKAVSQLSILMLKELKTDGEEAAAGTEEAGTDAKKDAAEDSGSKATAGGVIVKILKVLLIVVLVLLAAFILLFIAALFNDDVAAFMRTYIFRRGRQENNASAYYDDRLYNDPRNKGQNRNRPQQGQSARRPAQYPVQYTGQQNGQYPNQQQYPQYPNQQYAQNPGQQQYPQYQNQQYAQYPNQQQYPQYPNQQYAQNPGQQQYPQYPNQQYAQNPGGQQYQQYPNQQPGAAQYPRQQAPRRAAPGNARRQSGPAQAQPYSAENDPNLICQRQAQGGDPTATQTYSIPGRGGY